MPVIAVIGKKGSGKSSVVNWLLGYHVAPRETRVRTTYRYGTDRSATDVLVILSYIGVEEPEVTSTRIAGIHDYLENISGTFAPEAFIDQLMSVEVVLPATIRMYPDLVVTEFPARTKKIKQETKRVKRNGMKEEDEPGPDYDVISRQEATHVIGTYSCKERERSSVLGITKPKLYKLMTCIDEEDPIVLLGSFLNPKERWGALNVGDVRVFPKKGRSRNLMDEQEQKAYDHELRVEAWAKGQETKLKKWLGIMKF